MREIDVHHHIYPPRYLRKFVERMRADTPMFPSAKFENWTPQVSIDQMDRTGVAAAIGSITSPGVWFGNDEEGRFWARECNEYGAGLARDFPGRFGMFAAIPLPDTDGSLQEVAYALDVLKLDGIGLMSSYAGRYLGDPGFAPVFDDLNRRKAIVFVHPTMSRGGSPVPGINPPIIEFVVDTTRTIASLVYSRTLARCPDLRFVFPHGGGLIAMVITRLEHATSMQVSLSEATRAAIMPQGLSHELQKFYFDTAGILNNAPARAALWAMAPVSQILFGSDAPFSSGSARQTELLAALDLAAEDRRAIQRANAARLFPRFAD